MEEPGSGACVVCAKAVSSPLIGVHSSLISQNGSIHSQMGQVVGVEQLEEACRTTEFICSICLRLLLNIVNLECKLMVLKNEFRDTFLQGTESRKETQVVGPSRPAAESSERKSGEGHTPQAEMWDSTHLDQCVRPEKVDRFFSNIPSDSETNREDVKSIESQDKPEDSVSAVKHETSSLDSSGATRHQCPQELGTHLTLDASTAVLSDLLPPQCLLGDNAVSCSSQGEEETLKDEGKRSNCDTPMQESEGSPPSTANTSNPLQSAGNGGGAEQTLSTVATQDKQDSQHPLDSGGDDGSKETTAQPAQRRARRPRGQPQVPTPKRSRRRPNTSQGTVEVKVEVKDECTPREAGAEVKERTAQLSESLETCELCGLQFSDAKELGGHRGKAHSAVYRHTCQWCPNTYYREKSKLTQHLRRSHSITAHQCPGCKHQALSQNALDHHIISQHPESRFFECDICHKAFRTHRYLHFVHIKRCHLGLPVKYSCDKCNKGFVDKSSFENHKVTHSEARNYTCEFCGARFLTPYALKVHVNTHTREKKYVCKDCGSAFLRMCNLCAHRKRFHSSSDVKLVCEICGKSMMTRKDLRRHQLAQHSKEKPFRCPQCTRSYAAKESLKSHLRTHTGEKPYVCECGKAFHKSSILRRHQRSVHEGEGPQQEATAVEMNPLHVGVESELGREEHMVVITLKECNPPAVYTVQGSTPHLQEIMVSSEGPPQDHAEATLLAEGPSGLPLLHSSLGALGQGRLALSTPVLLTSLTAGPITVPGTTTFTQVTPVAASLSAHPADNFQQPPAPPSPPDPIVNTKNLQESQDDQDPLAGLGSTSCTDLLQLPGLHPATTQVSLVAPWPSSAL